LEKIFTDPEAERCVSLVPDDLLKQKLFFGHTKPDIRAIPAKSLYGMIPGCKYPK
jgi:hypothetical protein